MAKHRTHKDRRQDTTADHKSRVMARRAAAKRDEKVARMARDREALDAQLAGWSK